MPTTYTFNENIPAADNNPSQDQPLMLQNNQSTKSLIGEDHYTFGTSNPTSNIDGFHKQITLPAQNPAGAQTDPASIIYTDVDAQSASSNSNLWYRNADRIFPISALRACGKFNYTGVAGAVTLTAAANYNGFNVTSITVNANLTVTVVLTAGSVTGDNYIVLGNTKSGNIGTTIFPITISGTSINFGVSVGYTGLVFFAVLQI